MNPIVTKDLIIRDSRFEDIDTFYTWECTSEVNKYFSIGDTRTKTDAIREYIHDDENPAQRQYTICLKNEDGSEGDMIGRIILGDLVEGWKVEIWRIYIGDLSMRGKGYGKQAMLAMFKLCFEDMGLERVYLDHYTGNPASELYLSIGLKYEGVLRNNCRKNGVLYDVHLMSMLKDEYEALYKISTI